MGEKQKSKSEHLLMNAIEFDEEDLEANQQGVLSQKQQQVFRAERKNWRFFFWMVLVVSPVIIISVWNGETRTIPSSIVLGIIALLGLGYCWSKWVSWDRDCKRGIVHSAEGRIKLDVAESKQEFGYRVYIQDVRFEISKRVFLAFKNNDPYIIYYAPRTKRILSAEWLRE